MKRVSVASCSTAARGKSGTTGANCVSAAARVSASGRLRPILYRAGIGSSEWGAVTREQWEIKASAAVRAHCAGA
jgi:hypothetical protein